MTKFRKRRSPSPRRREELPHPTTHQSVRCGIRLLATEIQVTGGAESEYTLQRGRGGVRVHASERSCGIRQHTAECSTRHPTTRRRDSSYRWSGIRIHTAEGRGGVRVHTAEGRGGVRVHTAEGRGGVRGHTAERSCGFRLHAAECPTRHPSTTTVSRPMWRGMCRDKMASKEI